MLHKEWFPIDYPPEYFDRLNQPHIIALGAFYAREEQPEILVGVIMSRVRGYSAANAKLIRDSCK